MLNRRDLLKRLGWGAPALVLAPLAKSLSIPTPTPDSFTMNGWRCRWQDWHPVINQIAMHGVWLAYSTNIHEWHLYSSYPGRYGPAIVGSVYDLSQQPWQSLPTTLSTEAELNHYKNEALERLKRMIVRVGPPPLDPEWREKSNWYFG